jgi:hypothetical protein
MGNYHHTRYCYTYVAKELDLLALSFKFGYVYFLEGMFSVRGSKLIEASAM